MNNIFGFVPLWERGREGEREREGGREREREREGEGGREREGGAGQTTGGEVSVVLDGNASPRRALPYLLPRHVVREVDLLVRGQAMGVGHGETAQQTAVDWRRRHTEDVGRGRSVVQTQLVVVCGKGGEIRSGLGCGELCVVVVWVVRTW